jgi:uncharacterized RDD family membrane protein YckC
VKCPKCGYVGFEPSDRCRHCGYDFSLVDGPPVEPAAQARYETVPFPQPARERRGAASPAVETYEAESAPVDDLPLMTAPPPPSLFDEPPPPARTPLAVRRTTERHRSRSTPHTVRRSRPVLLEWPVADEPDAADQVAGPTPELAPAVVRVLAAGVDLLLLAAIDITVLYLTAQIAGLQPAAVPGLPLAPLLTFLIGLNIAYLAVFTANGGQTMGKMALGLRVEGTGGPLTFGVALVRVVVAVVGGLALGAGLLPALWRTDRRAVHDYVAHTRVVRVSA